MTVFIGHCVETEHRFLGTPSTKTESAFRQGVDFFRLCPGKAVYFRFSSCNSFPREKVNALEGALVEAFSNGFPGRTTAHQGAQMCVSVCTYLEVSWGGKRIVRCWWPSRILFKKRAENGKFGHPTRNPLDVVIPICRCLHDDYITRYGPFSKVVRNMRMANHGLKITCLSHWYDERRVNSGLCA